MASACDADVQAEKKNLETLANEVVDTFATLTATVADTQQRLRHLRSWIESSLMQLESVRGQTIDDDPDLHRDLQELVQALK